MSARPEPAPLRRGPEADVWRIRLDGGDRTVRQAAGLLDERERQRADRFRDALAADRFVLAHAAARSILGRYLGVSGAAVHWSVGPHGKPYFTGPWEAWQWSLSRADGLALLAVCTAAPVGVDLERVGTQTQALALARRFLPAVEAADVRRLSGATQPAPGEAAADPDGPAARVAYHRLLSRKEACVKASGGRLLDGLRLDVLTPGTVLGDGAFSGQRWFLRDLPAPPGFVAALATVGDAEPGLRLFDWEWAAGPPPDPAADSRLILPPDPAADSRLILPPGGRRPRTDGAADPADAPAPVGGGAR
ncbi:4'-phosphopantetheinyl transferase family protein [Streptomyces griseorubiginosus]|uniref:4'-phosphopantetheinyl transferase family protein n=1 Tax=Streptomyces griseorubiginosus TaxID=67304 RepID=UPI003639A379